MTFKPGQGGPGRKRGARNRLSHAFLEDLLSEWTEHGRETLKIARIERPIEFAKMVAGILPKEFEVSTTNTLGELSDDELESLINFARQQRALTVDAREPALITTENFTDVSSSRPFGGRDPLARTQGLARDENPVPESEIS